jgi:hypothetical protein
MVGDTGCFNVALSTGILRRRLPVAAKIALGTAVINGVATNLSRWQKAIYCGEEPQRRAKTNRKPPRAE